MPEPSDEDTNMDFGISRPASIAITATTNVTALGISYSGATKFAARFSAISTVAFGVVDVVDAAIRGTVKDVVSQTFGIGGALYGGFLGAKAGVSIGTSVGFAIAGPPGAGVGGFLGAVGLGGLGAYLGEDGIQAVVDNFSTVDPADLGVFDNLTPFDPGDLATKGPAHDRTGLDKLADEFAKQHADPAKAAGKITLRKLTPPEDPAINYQDYDFTGIQCFPAGTSIESFKGDEQLIENIAVNDLVASFAELASPTAPQVEGRVVQTFENVADEFLQLAYVNPLNSEMCHITSTPGHVYLTADGGWSRLCDLLDGSARSNSSIVALPGKIEANCLFPDARLAAFAVPVGQTEIVLADGTVVEAQAWSLQYSTQTADLFEQAEMLVARTDGGLALKPEVKKGWKTYNFEVAGTHTYIANGVRVHNDSSFATGFISNAVSVGIGLKAVSDVLGGRYDKGSLASGKTAVAYSASGAFVSRDPSNGWTSITNKAGATTVDTGFGWAFGPAVSNRTPDAPQSLAEALGLTTAKSPTTAKTAPAEKTGTVSAKSGSEGGEGPKPILIDLDGDGVEILTMDDNFVLFDWNDDGFLERTSWVAPDDGFLIFDEGNDGQISAAREVAFTRWLEDGVDLSELYSDAQILAFDANGDGVVSRDEALQALHGTADVNDALDTNGDGIISDLEAVAGLFDSNGDGVLNALDEGWDQFKIWRDADSDGEVDEGEIQSAADHNITQVGLELTTEETLILGDGTVVNGFIDVKQIDENGVEQTILGADAAMSASGNGVKITENTNGNVTYEFKSGLIEQHIQVQAGVSDYTVVNENIDLDAPDVVTSVTGNDLANDINASGANVAVKLEGGVGNDTLTGSEYDDVLIGGEGSDTLIGGAESLEYVTGDDGVTLAVTLDSDILHGGAGADHLYGGGGSDILIIDADDVVSGTVDGGSGYDAAFVEYEDGGADLNITLADHYVEYLQSGGGDDNIKVYDLGDNIFIDPTSGELFELKENVDGSFEYASAAYFSIDGTQTNTNSTHNYQSDELKTLTDVSGNPEVFDWLVRPNTIHVGGVQNEVEYANGGSSVDETQSGQQSSDDATQEDQPSVQFGSFTLLGGDGDDMISASLGDDRIVGEAGDDRLEGDYGNDTYYFGLGDGNDVILDVGRAPVVDELVNELTVSVTSEGYYTTNQTTNYGSGEDAFSVTQQVSAIGTSTLIQTQEYITFDIRAGINFGGIDTLQLGSFIRMEDLGFSLIDSDSDGALDDLKISVTNNETSDQSVNGSVVIENHMDDNSAVELLSFSNGISFDLRNITQADGTNADDTSLNGTDDNDVVRGFAGADIIHSGDGSDFLYAGAGDDRIEGGAGNDIYYYTLGDGNDRIIDEKLNIETKVTQEAYTYYTSGHVNYGSGEDSYSQYVTTAHTGYNDVETQVITELDGGLDALNFGKYISFSDLSFDRDGGDLSDLKITVSQSDTDVSGTITIEGYFEANNRIEWIVFDDGSSVYQSNIIGLTLATENADFVDWAQTSIIIDAQAGDDSITSGEFNDQIAGGAGNDTISAGAGDDLLIGGDGNDILYGGDGDDVLVGGDGTDKIHGGDGNDIIDVGQVGDLYGWQYVYGGNGDDTYHVSSNYGFINIGVSAEGEGQGSGDKVVFNDLNISDISLSFYDYATHQPANAAEGNTLIINWGEGTALGELQVSNEGQYVESYEFADGTVFSSLELISEKLNEAPVLTQVLADVAGREDVAILVTLPSGSFSDINGDTLNMSASLSNGSALPSWLSFDGVSQTFAGTPPANWYGSLDIEVVASDGRASVSDVFTLYLAPENDAPVLTRTLANVAGREDVAVLVTLPSDSFSDIDGDALTLSATLSNGSALPSWLSFDGASRTFAGTPPSNWYGSLDIEVVASDGRASVSDVFTLYHAPENDAPVLTRTLANVAGREDVAVLVTLPSDSFSDIDGDALTLSATLSNGSALPSWLSFDGASRTFAGTPPSNWYGSLDIEVVASDGSSSVSDVFTLNVASDDYAFIGGSSSADELTGGSGKDEIYGGAGDDTLRGGSGDDILEGGTGNNWLHGGDGNDTLIGGVNNDWLVGGAGADVLNGGGGHGHAFYWSSNAGVTVSLADGTGTGGHAQGDTFIGILHVNGSQYNDQLTGSNLSGYLSGEGGNDILYGLGGNDRLMGRAGNDMLHGGSGNDTLEGGVGSDSVFGGNGSDVYLYTSGDGNDVISDSGNSIDTDILRFTNLTNSQVRFLEMSGGNMGVEDLTTGNIITFHNQENNIFGGIDGVEFSDGEVADIQLFAPHIWQIGTAADDVLYGQQDRDLIDGGAGNDTIYGQSGNDQILGGSGDDTIYIQDGDDIVAGGLGNDQISSGNGNDVFVYSSGDGNDTILEYGNFDGFDILRFSDLNSADLSFWQDTNQNVLVQDRTTGDTITISYQAYQNYGVEQVEFADGEVWDRETLLDIWQLGTSGNDNIYGEGGDDRLSGENGNDTIYGQSGNDHLIGGAGDDILYGGGGNDTFSYTRGDGSDVLHDYGEASDFDVLQFADLVSDDISFWQTEGYTYGVIAQDLLTGQKITLTYQLYQSYGVEQLQFADGEVWSRGQLQSNLSMHGTAGNDVVLGQSGDDKINGDDGNDQLFGGLGDDELHGRSGVDTLTGDAGADVFHFMNEDDFDIVSDFEDGLDVLSLATNTDTNSFDDISIYQDGSDTLLEFVNGGARLENVNSDLINADDFVF